MPYSEFTLKEVVNRFQLTLINEPDLFASVAEVPPSDVFLGLLKEYMPLALAINTEKIRSELLVAPLLVDLRNRLQHRISLFSGVDFSVDPDRGLNGICDFLLSRSPEQQFIQAPAAAIVEAKNDNIKSGLGQCVAEMLAAQLFNEREGITEMPIFGAVTTGTNWRFLQLAGQTVRLDQQDYFFIPPAKVLGILIHFLTA